MVQGLSRILLQSAQNRSCLLCTLRPAARDSLYAHLLFMAAIAFSCSFVNCRLEALLPLLPVRFQFGRYSLMKELVSSFSRARGETKRLSKCLAFDLLNKVCDEKLYGRSIPWGIHFVTPRYERVHLDARRLIPVPVMISCNNGRLH